MQQKGVQINSSTVIDHLVYSYLQPGSWSNKLANVIDNSGNTAPLGDYQQGTNTGNDFFYDGNGNMIVDSNKNTEGIVYNILNLPQMVPMKGKGTISYVYDANGSKLEKLVVDSTVSQTSPLKDTTLYSGIFVYNNDSLQYIGHEEGRIRPKLINPTEGWVSSNIEYVYDYFIKDHLGNTRMVLSEETEQDSYVATMEPQNATLENELFDSVASTQYPKPAGFDSDTANHYVSMLDASSSGGTRIGPMIILKVMAGDTVTASTYCWYNTPVQAPTGPSLLSSLVPALAGGSVAVSSERLLAEQPAIDNILTSNLPAFLSYKDGKYVNTSPKAFLNWALFDDRFNYVTGGVTQVPVIASGNPSVAITANTPVSIPKNGYLYVYVSNESPQSVYFDNVSIQDHRGPLLEENHYYPFGLTMGGISDKALKPDYAENNYRYNGKELQHQEFSDGTGLEKYDYGARMQDPQIGRWWTLDPLAGEFSGSSPYSYTSNNPIRYIDPDGRSTSTYEAFSSVDIDQNGIIKQINLDGDPGVYMNIDGVRSLVGFMDPGAIYKIGGRYKYYNKADYYEKHPVFYIFWIIKCETCDPNPDQNNLTSAGEEVMGSTTIAVLTDGIFSEGQVAETAAETGISVIGPRDTYIEFAKKIGAQYLEIPAGKIWDWAANLKFLKGVVARGDDVIFAGKFDPKLLDKTSALANEIDYLISHGYKWTSDFTKLIKK
jgi:RHS repeat-associated protein